MKPAGPTRASRKCTGVCRTATSSYCTKDRIGEEGGREGRGGDGESGKREERRGEKEAGRRVLIFYESS